MPTAQDLFNKDTSNKILSSISIQDTTNDDIESPDYVREVLLNKNKFIPPIDYSNPANFVAYGLASEYYSNSINYILLHYPYDGSLKEKVEWEVSASYLDKFVFDNLYPRTAGFITMGLTYASSSLVSSSNGYSSFTTSSYISFKGGPNSASAGMPSKSLFQTFTLSNIYDPSTRRGSNLEISGGAGITLDFWLRKDSFISATSESAKQVIFDVWNSQSFGTPTYGRFRVELHPGISGESTRLWVELSSGSSGLSFTSSGSIIPLGRGLNLVDGNWHQYSISIINTGSNMLATLYTSGTINDTLITGSSINAITGSMIGTIGSLLTTASGSVGSLGWGGLSGSLDEVRFWKVKRTSKQIGRYWFSQVGGGVNTSPFNASLGVYYKFNEGIINTSSFNPYDTQVLDYSGRVSNGIWNGYIVGSRNTSSALELSNASPNEFKDPIVYPFHPSVSQLTGTLQQSASAYDYTNSSNIYSLFPSWITEDDEERGTGELKKLTQTMASYFDNLFLQIRYMPRIKDTNYLSSSFYKPLPFASRLLETMGMIAPEVFTNATALEDIGSRDDFREYSQKIYDVKNTIYQNLYNNLSYIYKSKGTEKALRNAIRCFGVDDELIKINLYADNTLYELNNNVRYVAAQKKYIDFNHTDKFNATVYQITSSAITGTRSYVASPNNVLFHGNTYQIDVIFPKKFPQDSPLFFNTPFTNVSIFGAHTANCVDNADKTWVSPDIGNFQVLAVKPQQESPNVSFLLTGTAGYVLPVLSSSVFTNVYDNNRWSINVRIRPQTWPWTDGVSGSANNNFIVEFNGYNSYMDLIVNSFAVSGTISSAAGQNFMTSAKRFYAGAHITNFTGSSLQSTDVKLSSMRVWMDYLVDDEIIAHSKDVLNYGRKHPYRNAFATELSRSFGT